MKNRKPCFRRTDVGIKEFFTALLLAALSGVSVKFQWFGMGAFLGLFALILSVSATGHCIEKGINLILRQKGRNDAE